MRLIIHLSFINIELTVWKRLDCSTTAKAPNAKELTSKEDPLRPVRKSSQTWQNAISLWPCYRPSGIVTSFYKRQRSLSSLPVILRIELGGGGGRTEEEEEEADSKKGSNSSLKTCATASSLLVRSLSTLKTPHYELHQGVMWLPQDKEHSSRHGGHDV
jgi:hypothetical protein